MLYDIIREKHKEAMKSRNALVKSAYGGVIAKVQVAEKSGNYQLPLEDTVVESLILKEIKELEETRSYYNPSHDMYEDISVKIAELNQYLPKMLSTEEVIEMIKNAATTETNKGKITGIVARAVGNSFDKKLIKGLVDEVLG